MISDHDSSVLRERFASVLVAEERALVDGIKEFGEMIHKLREAAGMSQAHLAQMARVPQGNLSKIELGRGRVGPTYATILRLSRALGLKLRWEVET